MKILPTYRDFAKTHANPDPSLRSGQAPTVTPHTTVRYGQLKKKETEKPPIENAFK